MVIAGFMYPFEAMYSERPSGDSTMASGRLPTCRCRPAGAIFHPLGSRVMPPPSGPGRSDAGTSPYEEASAAESATSTSDRPGARRRGLGAVGWSPQRNSLERVTGMDSLLPTAVEPEATIQSDWCHDPATTDRQRFASRRRENRLPTRKKSDPTANTSVAARAYALKSMECEQRRRNLACSVSVLMPSVPRSRIV